MFVVLTSDIVLINAEIMDETEEDTASFPTGGNLV